ncbi:S1C family serine protease, partial [Ruminococcus sp.]|uniref:S1C family serine protease n=1 Tax=Ruminococcus sp. TaxID=41978 RepID=UPI002E81503B
PIPKKTRGSAAKVVALALCCSLVGGACGAAGVAAYEFIKSDGIANIINTETDEDAGSEENVISVNIGEREDSKIQTVSVDTTKTLTAAEIYAANVNSTVGIKTSVNTNYFGYQTESAAAGSGFIITSDGYIVTNYHVIEGAESIQITTYDNKTYDAKVIGYDENNDVAVIKIDAQGLTPVVLGDSDNMNVGDDVVAIGNPLGELTFSLTKGAVSALNRNITIENQAMTLIQTDCAINSGNSGGALFNTHGEVIGITNAKYSSSGRASASVDNIGFAIPMNSVRDIITSIIDKGYFERVYIGVSVYSEAEGRGHRGGEASQNLIVESVEKGSPAEDAGVQAGDIITELNGEKVTAYSDLTSVISKSKAGDVVTLTVSRGAETLKIEVTLGVRQQTALPAKDSN